MLEKERSEGLRVRAEPLGVRVADGALWLEADPAWSGALNTVLVKKGVRVSELGPGGRGAAYTSLER